MERREQPGPITNEAKADIISNLVQAGEIHGDVHLYPQPLPDLLAAVEPPRAAFSAGAELTVGNRTFLIHDHLLRERYSGDGGLLHKQARCTQIAPVPAESARYGWLRRIEARTGDRRSRQALASLSQEMELLNTLNRKRVRGIPLVSSWESGGDIATLVTSWPAPRGGKPSDTLAALLDASAVLDRTRLFRLGTGLAGLCATLAALHEEGLTHRLLAPEMIVARQDGTLVLRDLGLAAWPAEPGEGPTGYQAPEQRVRSGRRPGPHTDVHQLGALAYHLITGQSPHAVAPLPLTRLAPHVPARLGRAIEDALAPEPADRPDMGSLAARLEAGCDDIS